MIATCTLEISSDQHDFVSIDKIGKSFEGRDMLVARICVGGCGNKKVMWIDSGKKHLNGFLLSGIYRYCMKCQLPQGIHAREWIAPAANLYMLNKLVEKASKGQDEDLFQVDWYIMPVLNPDGYVYTWTTNRMWRKTR